MSRTNEVAPVDDSRVYPGRGARGLLSAATQIPRVSCHTLLGRMWQKLREVRDVTKDLQSGPTKTHTLSSVTIATVCEDMGWYAGCAYYQVSTLCMYGDCLADEKLGAEQVVPDMRAAMM